MSTGSLLNEELLGQPFRSDLDPSVSLEMFKQIALLFANLQNSISVLTDLRERKSYIYHGALSEQLGISESGVNQLIPSIWEEDIFSRLHPDDLAGKYLMELQLFNLLKDKSAGERRHYYLTSTVRMRNKEGKYIPIEHKMFYAPSADSICLALCLYSHSSRKGALQLYEGAIVNSGTGEVLKSTDFQYKNLLTRREVEVLRLISKGKVSKEVSELLYISKNTVDRHRQNILEKLRVKNSIEACKVAEFAGII